MVTDEQKQRYLDFIREGYDKASAAKLVGEGLTASVFRRMTKPGNALYDQQFAQNLFAALRERGPRHPDVPIIPAKTGRSHTENGFLRHNHFTEQTIDQFIELVEDGTPAFDAARIVGTSMRQIHKRSTNDAAFGERFHLAKEIGYASYRARLEAEAQKHVFDYAHYPALRDQLITHIEQYRKALTTNRHEVGGLDGQAIRVLAEQHFADLPPEILEELIRSLEASEKRKQLKAVE